MRLCLLFHHRMYTTLGRSTSCVTRCLCTLIILARRVAPVRYHIARRAIGDSLLQLILMARRTCLRRTVICCPLLRSPVGGPRRPRRMSPRIFYARSGRILACRLRRVPSAAVIALLRVTRSRVLIVGVTVIGALLIASHVIFLDCTSPRRRAPVRIAAVIVTRQSIITFLLSAFGDRRMSVTYLQVSMVRGRQRRYIATRVRRRLRINYRDMHRRCLLRRMVV